MRGGVARHDLVEPKTQVPFCLIEVTRSTAFGQSSVLIFLSIHQIRPRFLRPGDDLRPISSSFVRDAHCAVYILIRPGIEFKPVKGDSLSAYRDFNQIGANFGVESIDVHLQIVGAESDESRRHLAGTSHGATPLPKGKGPRISAPEGNLLEFRAANVGPANADIWDAASPAEDGQKQSLSGAAIC